MATELLWIGAYLGLYLTSIGVAAWRLGKLANVSQLWRAAIPFQNVVMFGELLGFSKRTAKAFTWIMTLVPLAALFMFIFLGGEVANRTGRRRIIGYILTLPPLIVIGIPILALTAKHVVAQPR